MLRKVLSTQRRHLLRHNVRLCSGSSSEPSTDPSDVAPSELHTPVMSKELIKALDPTEGSTYIDMTFGAGGHTRRVLKQAPNIKIIALDRDPNAFLYAQRLKDEYPYQVIPMCGRFSDLPTLLAEHKIAESSIDGIICDLGCSSMQYDEARRGFSPLIEGPLDMRMDDKRLTDEPSAADVVGTIDEEDLYKVIKIYGMEKKAARIAGAIVDARRAMEPLRTTFHLADTIALSIRRELSNEAPNRALAVVARTFQALRMFVNNELNEINYAMQMIDRFVRPNGRLIVITYNKLEDTIVKRHIAGHVLQGAANALPLRFYSEFEAFDKQNMSTFMASNWQPLFKNVLLPSSREIDLNPISRSAKLRAAVRT